jgi:hypothetical protein
MNMKNYIRATAALLLGLLIGAGCGRGSSNSGSSDKTFFYKYTKQVTPAFAPSPEVGFLDNLFISNAYAYIDWGSGNPVYNIFYALREFKPSTDEGVIDRACMQKMLYDVDTLYNGTRGMAALLPAPIAITPPYNFGNERTYDKYAKDEAGERSIALNETATTVQAMVTWIWREEENPLKAEYGVFEATFNKTTQDITVDFVFSVDYDTSDTATDYNMRTWLTGNALTHAFEYKCIIGGDSDTDPFTTIVAKGISQGAGNKSLFKFDNLDNSVRYLVVDAGDGEDQLKNANTYTNPDDLPDSVSDYKAFVTGTALFGFSDLLSDSNDLNSGNDNIGTVYIYYSYTD